MKSTLLLVLVLAFALTQAQQKRSHNLRKRFLWGSLYKLAQPFIRKPQQQQQPHQQYSSPYVHRPPVHYQAPPVFQVSPTVAQPVRAPPSSGQLFIPLPEQQQQSRPQPPSYSPAPIYVPPSSYGQNNANAYVPNYGVPQVPQPPSYSPAAMMPNYNQQQQQQQHDAQWKPIQSAGTGSLFYGQMTGGVGAPGFPPVNSGIQQQAFPSADQQQPQQQNFPDIQNGVDLSVLVTDPFRGLNNPTVFLSGSDRMAPDGFTKVDLPISVLRSILNTGLESPTIYLATTSFAPSKDFVALSVASSTVDALKISVKQSNSTRSADLPSSAAEDLVVAIKNAAPLLVGSNTTADISTLLDIPFTFDVSTGDSILSSTSSPTSSSSSSIKDLLMDDDRDTVSMDKPLFDDGSDLPSVYLARRDADVPADYIRVLLPTDIQKELRRRVTLPILRSQAVSRSELTEAYLAPGTSTAVKSPLGMVPVHLSKEALQVLNAYAKEAEKIQDTRTSLPQLELPRTVLEQLSQDSSQRVRLIPGGSKTVVKTGSTDVFIAASDQRPPDGYVSIPLSDDAMAELKKNFLNGNLRSQDLQKGIPVRAYIAPADQKLPAGHVAVPLPDSILDTVRPGDSIFSSSSSSTSSRTVDKGKKVKTTVEESQLMKSSDTAVFMAPSRKHSPASFRKLNLPESVMEDLRQAVPAEKLADAGFPAKDLTSAYLADVNEFAPPGFISVAVPDTLVKVLETFTENHESSIASSPEEVVEEDEPKKNSTRRKPTKDTSSRTGGSRVSAGVGPEGSNIPRQIIDAIIDASKSTLKDVLKSTRDQDSRKTSKSRPRGQSRNNNKGRGGSGSGSGGRQNARVTTSDNDDNDFEDKDDIEKVASEDVIDLYQPQYQMSPFFPSSMTTYPYVDPYQYSGLWTYGPENAGWQGDMNAPSQTWPTSNYDYMPVDGYPASQMDGGFQNRDSYYYPETGGGQQDGGQYEALQGQQYDAVSQPQTMAQVQKRTGAALKS